MGALLLDKRSRSAKVKAHSAVRDTSHDHVHASLLSPAQRRFNTLLSIVDLPAKQEVMLAIFGGRVGNPYAQPTSGRV